MRSRRLFRAPLWPWMAAEVCSREMRRDVIAAPSRPVSRIKAIDDLIGGWRPRHRATARARVEMFWMRRGVALAALLAISGVALPAWAVSPGDARRLGGPEAQGPATASLSALHHNPAMLARLKGFSALATTSVGLDHLSVRRAQLGGTMPLNSLDPPVRLLDPTGDYFVGIGYMLDPIAVAAGVYSLSPSTRFSSDPSLRWHHVGDGDVGCQAPGGRPCPSDGERSTATTESRHDVSFAIAYNLLDRVQFGVTAHLPLIAAGFSRDEDLALRSQDPTMLSCHGIAGVDLEDPRCAERVTFSGGTRLRWFGLNDRLATRLDFALTFGVAFQIRKRVTVGLRYRTRPIVGRGRLEAVGQAVVCQPTAPADTLDEGIDSCTLATPVDALLAVPVAREVGIGVSSPLGRDGRWHLDTNFTWRDLCPGGPGLAQCNNADVRELSLIGLDKDAYLPSQTPVYRGATDQFIAEVWLARALTRKQSRPLVDKGGRVTALPGLSVLSGAQLRSPGTRPGAMTVAHHDGWTVGGSVGMGIALPRRAGTFHIVPGFSLDVTMPTRVAPGMYSPGSAIANQLNFGDINGPGAQAVLEGRARPSNAGSYFSTVTMLTLTMRWAERPLGN